MFGPFARTGADAGGPDQDNTFQVTGNAAVIFGIGLSVLVRFNMQADITFFSAVADFGT